MSGSSPGAGPIEHVGKADRAQRPSKHGWLWPLLTVLGVLGYFVGMGFFGPTARAAILGFACDLTMCSATGMTATGWLILALPAAAALACARLWRRLAKPGRVVLVVVTFLAYSGTILFVPGRNRDMSDLVKGPGSDQFIAGMLWTLAAAGLVLVLLFVLAGLSSKVPLVERRFNAFAAGGAALFLFGALGGAVAQAEPTWLRSTDIFPAQLTMNGDVLTRTSASDRRGCDGVLPDEAPLDRRSCVLTVLATFTTDDSDVLVTFRAVLYHSTDTAIDVRKSLPDELEMVGAAPGSITVISRTHSWVLVGNAAHADGRPVTADERRWVLWPLRQVSYYFIGVQGGIFIDPDPDDEISPRTR